MTTQPPPRVAPPAGWYVTPDGVTRWWDGVQWTGHQQRPSGPPSPNVWAVLAHVAFFVLPVVGVVVIRLTEGQRDPFVRHHSTEALNAHIFFAIVSSVVWVGALVSVVAVAGRPETVPWGFLVGWLLMVLTALCSAVLSVVGAVQASRGAWWRYPQPLRLVRGAAPRSPAATGAIT